MQFPIRWQPSRAFGRAFLATVALLLPLHSWCSDARTPARCLSGPTCSADEFGADFLWRAQEVIDQKKDLSESQVHQLEACFILAVSELSEHFFEKAILTKQAYAAKFKTLTAKIQDQNSDLTKKLQSAFANCPEGGLTAKEAHAFLMDGLLYRRPLTDLSEFRADWRAFEGKTLRFGGVGKYLMGVFYLQGSAGDMSPVRVDLSRLSKTAVADVIKRCSNIKQQCRVTVWAISWPGHAFTDIQATGPIELNR
ncbi:hypothetical protein [Pelomonas sp. SE-A7]|uniref:hypothetical protein n=1 Tax=Pelomonas sp. SE-A7 TaxID=3054953 RepID=UPI00259C9308|nr:hypothetical protein [Pelomonas sp. SE-A7]MDM4766161.1 hypothetical protein [Pelomonas sp. SE-A7]